MGKILTRVNRPSLCNIGISHTSLLFCSKFSRIILVFACLILDAWSLSLFMTALKGFYVACISFALSLISVISNSSSSSYKACCSLSGDIIAADVMLDDKSWCDDEKLLLPPKFGPSSLTGVSDMICELFIGPTLNGRTQIIGSSFLTPKILWPLGFAQLLRGCRALLKGLYCCISRLNILSSNCLLFYLSEQLSWEDSIECYTEALLSILPSIYSIVFSWTISLPWEVAFERDWSSLSY